jgi:DNA-binding NtrC family response regulator
MPTVLIIDDNPAVAVALEVLLSLGELRTVSARSPSEGLEILRHEAVDVVIQDMNFRADTTSGEEGAALFRTIHERHPELPVVLLTAWTQLASAVELVKAGAADYLAKPWDDTKLLTTVQNLAELSASRRELARRRHQEHRRRAELSSATTCAAPCSLTPRWSGSWPSPVRWRAPTCRS